MTKTFITILSLSLFFPNDAYDIIKNMHSNDSSKSIKATFNMKTVTEKGKIKQLDFTSWTKNENNNQKQIIWFTGPSSFKGMSFLKIQKDKTINMTMWHPKYEKTRKISSQDKGNSFMNSELTYEDLYARNIDQFNYNLIKEEIINNENCYIVESIPNQEINSNYSKHQTWISKERLVPIKEESYNLDNILYKKKSFYYNKENRIDSIKIENLKKKRYTVLAIKTIDTESEIKNTVFTERNLERLIK